MLVLEIGKILIHAIMYLATSVKVKCIGEVILKLMAERGEAGLWAKPPENISADHALQTVGKRRKHLMSICVILILAGEGRKIVVRDVPRHYSFNDTPMHSKIQLSKGFAVIDTPRHGGFFRTPMHFASSRRTYSGLPAWNAAWVPAP